MKLTPDFSELEQFLRDRRTPIITWRSDVSLRRSDGLPKIHKKLRREDIAELQTNHNKHFISETGDVFVVHIETIKYPKFQSEYKFDISVVKSGNKGYKFHTGQCNTITGKMRKSEFDDRYVGVNPEDGLFEMRIEQIPGKFTKIYDARLRLCGHCAKRDHTTWEKFDLQKHLKEGSQDFLRRPLHTPDTLPLPIRPENWGEKSREYRKSVGFICEDCGVDCSSNLFLLDTDHVNNRTSINHPGNFQALCKDCHRKKHKRHNKSHRMGIPKKAQIEIERLRREQGIKI